MAKLKIHISISKKALELLDKHFPDNRSGGIEKCISKFNEDEFTFNELKYYINKLKKSSH